MLRLARKLGPLVPNPALCLQELAAGASSVTFLAFVGLLAAIPQVGIYCR